MGDRDLTALTNDRVRIIAELLNGYTSDADDAKILKVFDNVNYNGKDTPEKIKQELPALLAELNDWHKIPQLVDELSFDSLKTLHHILVADLTKAFGKDLVKIATKEARSEPTNREEYLGEVVASLMYAAIDEYRIAHYPEAPEDITKIDVAKEMAKIRGFCRLTTRSVSDEREIATIFEKASPAKTLKLCYEIRRGNLTSDLLDNLDGNYAARVKRSLKLALSKAPDPKEEGVEHDLYLMASGAILCQPTWNMLENPGCDATFEDLIERAATLYKKGTGKSFVKKLDNEDEIIGRLIGEVEKHEDLEKAAQKRFKDLEKLPERIEKKKAELAKAGEAEKGDIKVQIREMEGELKKLQEQSAESGLDNPDKYYVRNWLETVLVPALTHDVSDKDKPRVQTEIIATIRSLDYPQFSELCYRIRPRGWIDALFDFFKDNEENTKELITVLSEKLQYALTSNETGSAMVVQVLAEAQDRTGVDLSKEKIGSKKCIETYKLAIREAARLYGARTDTRCFDRQYGDGEPNLNLPPVCFPHDEDGHGYKYKGDVSSCASCHTGKIIRSALKQSGGALTSLQSTWVGKVDALHHEQICEECHSGHEQANLLGVYSRYATQCSSINIPCILDRMEIDCRRCHQSEDSVGAGYTLMSEAEAMATIGLDKGGKLLDWWLYRAGGDDGTLEITPIYNAEGRLVGWKRKIVEKTPKKKGAEEAKH